MILLCCRSGFQKEAYVSLEYRREIKLHENQNLGVKVIKKLNIRKYEVYKTLNRKVEINKWFIVNGSMKKLLLNGY